MWVPNLPVTVLSTIAASAGVACIYKDLRGGPPFDKEIRADGKTVIITGASSGIGQQAAWEFAKRGATVFMACRNMKKCEAARREIVLETQNKYVYCRPCDLASAESIRNFVKRFKSEEPKLDVLVNNAGVMEPPRGVTKDGFEPHLGVNHFSHFLLTNLLLDTLKQSAPSRVVVVSSSIHVRGSIRREDLNMTANYDPRAAYAQSKLANLLFARELATRTLGSGVAVVAVDPGFSDTSLSRNVPLARSVWNFVVYPVFWMFMKSPRVAAQTILHAALDPNLAKCSGDYYVSMEKAEPSKEAQDFELAQWLWKVSEKWTRLAEHQAMLEQAQAA